MGGADVRKLQVNKCCTSQKFKGPGWGVGKLRTRQREGPGVGSQRETAGPRPRGSRGRDLASSSGEARRGGQPLASKKADLKDRTQGRNQCPLFDVAPYLMWKVR